MILIKITHCLSNNIGSSVFENHRWVNYRLNNQFIRHQLMQCIHVSKTFWGKPIVSIRHLISSCWQINLPMDLKDYIYGAMQICQAEIKNPKAGYTCFRIVLKKQ